MDVVGLVVGVFVGETATWIFLDFSPSNSSGIPFISINRKFISLITPEEKLIQQIFKVILIK